MAKSDSLGIVVADKEEGSDLKKLLSERIQWRYRPVSKKKSEVGKISPKYIYEFRSNYVLDQLHYVESNNSLMVQVIDNIGFIFKRTLEYLYLLNYSNDKRPKADMNLLPVNQSTFNFLVQSCGLEFAYYNKEENDVSFFKIEDYFRLQFDFDESRRGNLLRYPTTIEILSHFTPFK